MTSRAVISLLKTCLSNVLKNRAQKTSRKGERWLLKRGEGTKGKGEGGRSGVLDNDVTLVFVPECGIARRTNFPVFILNPSHLIYLAKGH